MAQKIYAIENLACAHCAAKIEDAIRNLPEVEHVSITLATNQLRLTAADPDGLMPQICRIFEEIEPGARPVLPHHHEHRQEHSHNRFTLPLLLAGGALFIIGLVLEALSLPLWAKGVFLAAYLLLGFDVLKQAALNLVKGNLFDEHFLMGIATIGAFFIDEFPEAVGIMLFYRIGEYFEDRAVNRSRTQIMDAVDLRPETVTLITGETIPAEDAHVGDCLRIRPGDRIPLDGTVLDGESRIDTSPVTGEAVPVRAMPGDKLLSGCVNINGQLTLRVDKELSQSMVTKILRHVEEAAAGKPKIQRFITRFSRVYTPAVVIIAAATAIIPSLFTGNWNYWVYTALSFLVMSCPCALVLSVPLAFFSGIGVASKQGILFKSGSVMEAMAGIRCAVMDKTGTLTKGDFTLQTVVGGDEVLTLCAACEQASSHPIAQSIVAAVGNRPLPTPDSVEELSGRGIHAKIGGVSILCGNEQLMADLGVSLADYRPKEVGTRVIVAKGGVYMGYLVIADTVKDGAAEAVSALHGMGIHTAMLTGDRTETAQAVAAQLGVDTVHAQLLPEEKLTKLQALRTAHGAALFVGDGINDAPVLSGADVGAAMGSGADAAIEVADLVFLTNQPQAIPEALTIAKKTKRIAMENVVFALTIKAIVMVLGLLGCASMWAAVFADSGVAMLCVLNSIRMLYRPHRDGLKR